MTTTTVSVVDVDNTLNGMKLNEYEMLLSAAGASVNRCVNL
jgi:hypothetical protein